MDRVFISYSRKDKEFVQRLHSALKGHGIDAWVDWEDIPLTADWQQEVYAGIDAAETFVAVLSPDALYSEVCQLEVQHATRHNKRVIPIVYRDVDPRQVPPDLARHNWLFLRDSDSFDEGVDVLVEAINTDLDWVRAHTRILVRAAEWESSGYNSSFLMRGADLRKAEAWLSRAGTEESPGPTALHTRYVLASRKSERNQLRFITVIALLGLVAATILTFFAWSERSQAVRNADLRATAEAVSQTRLTEAERQQKIALSLQLAAQSRERLDAQYDLSLLLGVEANRTADTIEAKRSLLEALQHNQHLGKILRGQAGMNRVGVESVALSFSIVASGGDDNNILLWDPDTGERMGEPLRGHNSPVVGLRFSPNAEILASGGRDGSIILWSMGTREPVGPALRGLEGQAHKLAFSPDGKTLSAFGVGRSVTLWDLGATPPISHTHLVQAPVLAVGFTHEGKAIAAAAWSNSIILWDVAADTQIGNALVGHESNVDRAEFDLDASLLASSASEVTIVWEVEAQQLTGKMPNTQGGSIIALAFSPDGSRYLATASDANAITVWDVGTQNAVDRPFVGHTGLVTSLTFSSVAAGFGDVFLSGSKDGTVILWSLDKVQALSRPFEPSYISGPPDDATFAVALSPDDKEVAAAGTQNTITRWATFSLTNKSDAQIEKHTAAVRSVAYTPDGKFLVSGSEDRSVMLWNLTKDPPMGLTLSGHKDGVLGVASSPDSRLVASASRDETVILWDTDNGQPVGTPLTGHGDTVTSVAFSPDGKTLASGGWDQNVILWDVTSHKQLGEPLKGHTGDVWSVVFSPDGQMLASAGEDRAIILWDVAARTAIGRPLVGHTGTVNTVAFSPDGKLLASSSTDGTIILWDMATRLKINPPLVTDRRTISGLAFSPDSKTLISGGGHVPVLWDVSIESWQARACKIAARNLTQEEWEHYMGDEPYRKSCPNIP